MTKKSIKVKKVPIAILINQNVVNQINELTKKTLPVEMSMKIINIYNKMAEVSSNYEKSRLELISKYCEKDESGNNKQTEDGKEYILTDKDAFQAEVNALLGQDVDIDIIQLSSYKNLMITPTDLALLLSSIAEF